MAVVRRNQKIHGHALHKENYRNKIRRVSFDRMEVKSDDSLLGEPTRRRLLLPVRPARPFRHALPRPDLSMSCPDFGFDK